MVKINLSNKLDPTIQVPLQSLSVAKNNLNNNQETITLVLLQSLSVAKNLQDNKQDPTIQVPLQSLSEAKNNLNNNKETIIQVPLKSLSVVKNNLNNQQETRTLINLQFLSVKKNNLDNNKTGTIIQVPLHLLSVEGMSNLNNKTEQDNMQVTLRSLSVEDILTKNQQPSPKLNPNSNISSSKTTCLVRKNKRILNLLNKTCMVQQEVKETQDVEELQEAWLITFKALEKRLTLALKFTPLPVAEVKSNSDMKSSFICLYEYPAYLCFKQCY